MSSEDDQKLVFQTLSGDREAFSQLMQKYNNMVYAYVLVKVGDPRDSDDVMQEIFMRAYRHLNQLQYPYRFGNWLYTIMINECNRWLKQASKKRQREISIEEIDKSILQETLEYARATENWYYIGPNAPPNRCIFGDNHLQYGCDGLYEGRRCRNS